MVKNNFFSLIILLSIQVSAIAQHKVWVIFKDKSNSIEKQSLPALSTVSIEKKLKRNIPIDERDYPVSQHYISELKNKGYKIISTSRWFNAV
ncbi:MAG: peptidase S8, partial [Bacteroidia bacterium]